MGSSSNVKVDGCFGGDDKTVLNSSEPVAKFCYTCNRVVWTKIKFYPTSKTRLIAAGLSLCLLCWMPYFFHWKTEIDHHCCYCDDYLGTYDPEFEKKIHESLTNILLMERREEKKQPQKKYREVGRRCGEYTETITGREEIIRVYSNVLQ